MNFINRARTLIMIYNRYSFVRQFIVKLWAKLKMFDSETKTWNVRELFKPMFAKRLLAKKSPNIRKTNRKIECNQIFNIQ